MENWLPVVGYDGHYEVSDLGSVRSLDRTINGSMGRLVNIHGKTLSKQKHPCGYRTVNLSVGGVLKTRLIHHLVLEAFCCSRPTGMECRHLDGDKTNNAFDNLRWGTSKENLEDCVRHGNFFVGEKTSRAKLNRESVRAIRFLIKNTNITQKKIAQAYGVFITTIYNIKSRKTWGWLDDQAQ